MVPGERVRADLPAPAPGASWLFNSNCFLSCYHVTMAGQWYTQGKNIVTYMGAVNNFS